MATRIAALTVLAMLGAYAHADQPVFGGNGDDTRVEISAVSSGCFHYATTKYTFADGVLYEDGRAGPRLTTHQAKKLDAYFNFVREYGNSGGCTTTDEYQIDKYDGDALISSERLVDETCISSARNLYEGHPGVTSPMQTPAEIIYAFRHPEGNSDPSE